LAARDHQREIDEYADRKCLDCGVPLSNVRWNTKYCKGPGCVHKRRMRNQRDFLDRERKRMGWAKREPKKIVLDLGLNRRGWLRRVSLVCGVKEVTLKRNIVELLEMLAGEPSSDSFINDSS